MYAIGIKERTVFLKHETIRDMDIRIDRGVRYAATLPDAFSSDNEMPRLLREA
jgi:hypothetical protein